MAIGKRLTQIATVVGAGIAIITFAIQYKDKEPQLLYEFNNTIHIGDEEFSTNAREWVALQSGKECLKIQLPDKLDAKKLLLTYEPFGLESGFIKVNSEQPISLASQQLREYKRPNYWSLPEKIIIPVTGLTSNKNSLAICADVAPREENIGDLDDFQLRNITVVALY